MSINELIKFYGIKTQVEEKFGAKDLEIGGSRGLEVHFKNVSFSFKNEVVGKVIEIKDLELTI